MPRGRSLGYDQNVGHEPRNWVPVVDRIGAHHIDGRHGGHSGSAAAAPGALARVRDGWEPVALHCAHYVVATHYVVAGGRGALADAAGAREGHDQNESRDTGRMWSGLLHIPHAMRLAEVGQPPRAAKGRLSSARHRVDTGQGGSSKACRWTGRCRAVGHRKYNRRRALHGAPCPQEHPTPASATRPTSPMRPNHICAVSPRRVAILRIVTQSLPPPH